MKRTPVSQPRGYVLMVVVVLGVVLASLAAILLYATGRDRAEARQQSSSIRSVYAAESAVAVGIEHLRELLEEKSAPDVNDLNDVEARTIATLGASLSSATFPVLSVKYYDPVLNTVSDTPISTVNSLQTITEGINKGLKAQQTPIQVLATARVDNASSSVADAIRVDLIPVFQFGVFFEGDLETWIPNTTAFNGRVHTNGNLWLSNGSDTVDFNNHVTAANLIRSRSAFASSVTAGTNKTRALDAGNTLRGIPTDLPKSPDSAQKTAIESVFGVGGRVGDRSTGIQPLTVPIRSSSAPSCVDDNACGAERACMKARVTDTVGTCTDKIASRPPRCGNGDVASFGQSLAVELIKRPAAAYATAGLNAPYADDGVITNPYTADFGPRPAIAHTPATTQGLTEINDLFEVDLARSVPHVRTVDSQDDSGAVVDRMYWKADIRIIDGVWYKKDSNTPVFDPELVNYTSTAPSPTDLNHKFGRVLRYSWWWDARENRVYCNSSDKNCISDGNVFHRGAQIRSSDFDMAAFMSLLQDSNARNLLFTGGVIPAEGLIVYMSETYDPVYEDANTKLPRAANVRNFLNFPVAHNHLDAATITNATGLPARVAPVKTATGPTPAPPTAIPTPYQIGFYPENLWGRHAGTNFQSLTPAITATNAVAANDAERVAAYSAPNTAGTASLVCQRASALSASRIPGTRPTDFTTPSFTPPCVQAGATPLGPENAVRIVRGASMPSQGFTFVTDNRLYIHGDINVVGTSTNATTKQDIGGKVAFMADSITLLSEKFDDRTRQDGKFEGFFKAPTAYTAETGVPPFSTTGVAPWSAATTAGAAPAMCSIGNSAAIASKVNASLLMGDVPSCLDAGDANGNRSGGITNFPRFAEDWNSIPSVITGSMVSLFRSERGNARFINSGYSGTFSTSRLGSAYETNDGCSYRPPNQTWTFDTVLLTDVSTLPPGTPRVVATDRLRWVRR